MIEIALVNMPFSDWHRPSFALSQLTAITRREFPNDTTVDAHYLNQDFASLIGVPTYSAIAGDMDHLMTGVGDWLFRQIAFPELKDNSDTYFRRYYLGPRWRDFRQQISDMRSGLEDFCNELIDRYQLASKDVIGFTSMFAQTVPSIAMAHLIKERNPNAITVLGGANCETPMGDVLARNVTSVDYVFSGPALHSFPDFLGCLLKEDRAAIHGIRGIRSRQASPSTSIGAERDIDDFFEPDYQSFISSLEARPELVAAQAAGEQPILYFETSRGCWWGERSHCTFCGLNGLSMGYRSMSPATALRQFRWLFSFAPWCKTFHCTDNIMPKNYLREVFPHLEKPQGWTIFYEVKLPLSERELRIMADAGVTYVQPGIEALATDTLKLMRKGTTAFQNIQFLKNCVGLDIDPAWNLLLGFPGEDEEVYRKYGKDIPLLTHLPPPIGAYMIRYDRYSPYFTQRDTYNLELTPMDFYSLIYPFSEQDIDGLAYFFQDISMTSYLGNAIAWVSPLNEHVEKWRHSWNGNGERPRLDLESKQDGTLAIFDSRFGTAQRIDVDGELEILLRRLSSPARCDAIRRPRSPP